MVSIYVGNLPFSVSQEELEDAFRMTNFSSCEIQMNYNGRSKGFALVTYDNEDGALQAINTMNESDMSGRKVIVRMDRGSKPGRSFQNNNVNVQPQEVVEPPSAFKVYVGSIPFSSTEEDIANLFSGYNLILAQVVKNNAGKSRGYALVYFETLEDAQIAASGIGDNATLGGRDLSIRLDSCSGTSVYVGSLSWNVDDVLLLQSFFPYNPVKAFVATDRHTGRSRGWGTVQFADSATAQTVINEMDGSEIDGRAVHIRVDGRN